MTLDERPTLLAIQHVPWEGPHRILDACHDLRVRTVKPLAGHPLPAHGEVAGAVVMGGPMNVDEVERFPGLAAEREWLAEAVEQGMPVLGICLGAQLLARALGAEVRPGAAPEIGFAPVEVTNPDDPLLGALAPRAEVLHWHGDAFDLPDGAEQLASSERTACQAGRQRLGRPFSSRGGLRPGRGLARRPGDDRGGGGGARRRGRARAAAADGRAGGGPDRADHAGVRGLR